MKRSDLYLCTGILLFFGMFFVFDGLYQWYVAFNRAHGMCTTFVKFALLATLGEVLALRIRTGQYALRHFGLLPKAIVWGVLGLTVKLAFVVFATGVPAFLEYMGLHGAAASLHGPIGPETIAVALAVSAVMNLFYAPLMMLTHRITDIHIGMHQGSIRALVSRIPVGQILGQQVNWQLQWRFVFCRTIFLFWIPAHTISFLLPPDYQTLFAAVLSVLLGLLLAFASSDKPAKS